MKLINYDTHAHLDLYKDLNSQIDYVERMRSYTIIVTNLPKLYQRYISEYSNLNYSRFSLGLHPELAVQYKSQLPLFIELAESSKYVGEIGLDFTKGVIQEQIKIFEEIIDTCNSHGNKIISIHNRMSAKHVIDIVGENSNKIILHWFSGTMKDLKRAINLNYYFSINTNMVLSKKGREIVRRIPYDKLLIESDAPFTNATRTSNYSLVFIKLIIRQTAELLNKSEDDIRNMYSVNFKRLLRLEEL